jgi:hypothetical protein
LPYARLPPVVQSSEAARVFSITSFATAAVFAWMVIGLQQAGRPEGAEPGAQRITACQRANLQNRGKLFNDIKQFADRNHMTKVTLGETSMVAWDEFTCGQANQPWYDGAKWAVTGYTQSDLYRYYGGVTMFLPFNVLPSPCYKNPGVLWPYDSRQSPL